MIESKADGRRADSNGRRRNSFIASVRSVSAMSLLAGLVAAALSTSLQAENCLRYNDPVTLEGLLSRETFAEQPNYESIEAGDRPATYFFVLPPPSTCVDADKDQDAVAVTGKIQLVFDGKSDDYGRLRPYLGKSVTCQGRLFQAFSGHHHSAVLLDDARCRPAAEQGPSSNEIVDKNK